MIDEIDFELCLNIDQYVSTSRRSGRAPDSTLSPTERESLQPSPNPNSLVRKHSELESPPDEDEDTTPGGAPRRKKLKITTDEQCFSPEHDNITYLYPDSPTSTSTPKATVNDNDQEPTDLETETESTTSEPHFDAMDIDTSTEPSDPNNSFNTSTEPSNSFNLNLTLSPILNPSPITPTPTRPAWNFTIYEDLDPSTPEFEEFPEGIIESSFTTSSSPVEDKENTTPEETDTESQPIETWTRPPTERFFGGEYEIVRAGEPLLEVWDGVTGYVESEGEEGGLEDLRVSFHSLSAVERVLPFPIPVVIPLANTFSGVEGLEGRRRRRRCLRGSAVRFD